MENAVVEAANPGGPKIIVHGTLGENGDTWFILTASRMVLVDAPFAVDLSLEHQTVSSIGRMGIPASAPGITKLLAERIISQAAIAHRAYDLYQSTQSSTTDENWFRAERELLGVVKA